MSTIAENIAAIRARIDAAARTTGRTGADITLVAATKMNDAARVREAVAAGIDACGENRVQEMTEKLAQGAYTGAPLHFIGHLQTNKVRQVVGKVDLIQSVDSPELLAMIEKRAAGQGIVQDILLEVNIGGEAAKSGVDPAARDYILHTIISNYSKDATVILSTHLIGDIEPVLDEAIFLKDGRVFAHRSVEELRETEGMSVDAYFREVFKC